MNFVSTIINNFLLSMANTNKITGGFYIFVFYKEVHNLQCLVSEGKKS